MLRVPFSQKSVSGVSSSATACTSWPLAGVVVLISRQVISGKSSRLCILVVLFKGNPLCRSLKVLLFCRLEGNLRNFNRIKKTCTEKSGFYYLKILRSRGGLLRNSSRRKERSSRVKRSGKFSPGAGPGDRTN